MSCGRRASDQVADDVLDDLPALFRRLPDNTYRIYLVQGETEDRAAGDRSGGPQWADDRPGRRLRGRPRQAADGRVAAPRRPTGRNRRRRPGRRPTSRGGDRSMPSTTRPTRRMPADHRTIGGGAAARLDAGQRGAGVVGRGAIVARRRSTRRSPKPAARSSAGCGRPAIGGERSRGNRPLARRADPRPSRTIRKIGRRKAAGSTRLTPEPGGSITIGS